MQLNELRPKKISVRDVKIIARVCGFWRGSLHPSSTPSLSGNRIYLALSLSSFALGRRRWLINVRWVLINGFDY
jgi:hypothetical protein